MSAFQLLCFAPIIQQYNNIQLGLFQRTYPYILHKHHTYTNLVKKDKNKRKIRYLYILLEHVSVLHFHIIDDNDDDDINIIEYIPSLFYHS